MISSIQHQATLEVIQRKIQEQQNLVKMLETALSQLSAEEAKELRDVERLENDSVIASFFKLVGMHEGKLTQEQAEYLSAKAEREHAAFELEEALRVVAQLESRQEAIKREAAAHRDLLEDKRRYYEAMPAEAQQRVVYDRFAKKESEQLSLCVEVSEALEVCREALLLAESAAAMLKAAEEWAMFDVAGGGLVTDVMKYDKLESAQRELKQLRGTMGRLKRELDDIEDKYVLPSFGVDSSTKNFDIWMDNVFTDYQVKAKIHEQYEAVNGLRESLVKLRERLEIKHLKAIGALKAATEALEGILLD